MHRDISRIGWFGIAVGALAALSACDAGAGERGGEEPATRAEGEQADQTAAERPAADDLRAGCVAVFERQRECQDVFLPALVDRRIQLDRPPGIAAKASSQGREAILAEARTEWASDSSDASIAATCDRLTTDPPAEAAAMLDQAEGCYGQATCQSFTECMVPLMAR